MMLIISCEQKQNKIVEVQEEDIVLHTDIDYEPKNDFIYEHKQNIYNNSNIDILTYGIDKYRVQNIINTISPMHFEELVYIQFIYSNKEVTIDNRNGIYYYATKSITLYIHNEGDDYIKYLLLHELKHHYCFTHNKMGVTDEEVHQGCFLNTPIDREYGFIK